MSEAYIPSARQSVIAYCGYTTDGRYRRFCVTCCDASPLTDAHKIYGDLYTPGPENVSDRDDCECCGVSLLSLSQQCQREHDEQQARWARGPVLALVEYGIPAAVRCRVY
jgi:hypothetical protein